MARIEDFKFVKKRTGIQSSVEATYSYGDVNGGDLFVNIRMAHPIGNQRVKSAKLSN